MAETNIKILKLEVDTGTGAIKVNGITKSIDEATLAFDRFSNSAKKAGAATKDLDKATQDFNSVSGIAGATVNELGRTISDLPFGITAITNNISQLGSLFGLLVQKASKLNNGLSTTKNVIALLKKEFLGPLGVLFLFQGAVALLETFAGSSKKAKEEVSELNRALGSAGGQISVLETYKEVLDDSTSSTEQQEAALQSLKKEGYDPLIGTLEEFLEAKAKILLFDATKGVIQKEIEDAITEQRVIEDQIEALNDKILERTNTLEELRTGSGAGVGTTAIGGLIDKAALKSELESLKEQKNSIISTQTDLTGELKEKYTTLVSDLEENDFLCILFGTCKKGKGTTKKLAKQAKATGEIIGTTIEQARKLADEGDSIIDKLLGAEPSDWAKDALGKNATEALKGLYKQYIEPEEEDFFSQWVDRKLDQIDELTFGLEGLATGLDAAAMITDAAYQKELDIEQNKTTAINNELKKRLANEELSANERKGIQGQIAANDEALRIKQEAIEKKRFKTEKAFRISLTLIDTASSAMRAYASQLIPADPSSLIRAKIAAATTTAFGLAQVASIAMQQFVSSQSSLGAGAAATSGSTGANVQAPDFNIVGQSNVNQLAEVVSSQLDKPIKTYVVTKDVSTAQSMERNIVNGASIG